jgi:hypothetical protein
MEELLELLELVNLAMAMHTKTLEEVKKTNLQLTTKDLRSMQKEIFSSEGWEIIIQEMILKIGHQWWLLEKQMPMKQKQQRELQVVYHAEKEKLHKQTAHPNKV